MFHRLSVLLLIAFGAACPGPAAIPSQIPNNPAKRLKQGGVFVVGGIHQAHDKATYYTYKRMGEIYDHLRPDVLAVEVQQKYFDDGSLKGMPFDFKRHMVPLAQQHKIPIYGVDWWHEERGKEWRRLQRAAAADVALQGEIALIGGHFQLMNAYFTRRDFREINAPALLELWVARNTLKYSVLRKSTSYRPIATFELERHRQMATRVYQIAQKHPDQRILVAVGIDHKVYIERALRLWGIRVLDVEQAISQWWR